jgi:hypothetical protein
MRRHSAGHPQEQSELKGSARRAQTGGMGKAAGDVLRGQPRRQHPARNGRILRARFRARSPELQREGPVPIWGVGKCVAARAGALDGRHQCGAITGLTGTHHLGQTCHQIGQARLVSGPQTSLWHWRHEPGRAGPRVHEVGHAKVSGQCDIGAVAGPLPPAPLQPASVKRGQQRKDVNVACLGVVVTPSLPWHLPTRQPQGGPHHADGAAPARPGQVAPTRQGKGHGQDFGRRARGRSQRLEELERRGLSQDRHRRGDRRGRSQNTGLGTAGIAERREGRRVGTQIGPHRSPSRGAPGGAHVVGQAGQDQEPEQLRDADEAGLNRCWLIRLLQRQEHFIQRQTDLARF